MIQIPQECIPGTVQASCCLQGVWRSLSSSVLVPEHHTDVGVEGNPLLRVVLGTFEMELKMAWGHSPELCAAVSRRGGRTSFPSFTEVFTDIILA